MTPRRGVRAKRIAILLTLVTPVLVAACDSSTNTTYVPPSFTLPSFNIPTYPAATSTTRFLGQEVIPPETDSAQVTTTAAPPAEPPDSPAPDVVDPGAILEALPPVTTVPPPPPQPPPSCDALLAAVQAVTGPAGVPGGDDTPERSRCYGTVLSGRFYSYTFEIWSFPSGAVPTELPIDSSYVAVDDPRALVGGMTWSPRVDDGGGVTANRAIVFPCGGGTCWLYLEVGAFGGAVGDQLEASVLAIANQLASGAAPAPVAPAPRPHPTCEGMGQAIDAVIAALVPANSGATADHLVDNSAEQDVENGWVVVCSGQIQVHRTARRDESFIALTYLLVMAPPDSPVIGRLRGSYHWAPGDRLAGAPDPNLGDGVLADDGSYVAGVFWDGRPAGPNPPTAVLGRTIQFPCGPLVCWATFEENAYSTPYVTSLKFLQPQLLGFIAAANAYVTALPLE